MLAGLLTIVAAFAITRQYASDVPADPDRPYFAADGTAHFLDGAQDLKESDPAGALDLLRQALVVSPLNVDALVNTASIKAQSGGTAEVDAIYRHVRDLTNRNLTTLYHDLDGYIRNNDQKATIRTATLILNIIVGPDNSLNTYIPLRAALIDHLVSLSGEADNADLIVAGLQRRPLWRGSFLTALAQKGPGTAFPDLADRLGDVPPAGSAWQAYLQRLIGSGQSRAAFATWASLLPADAMERLGYLNNGDFEDPALLPPFGWQIKGTSGADIAFDTSTSASGATSLEVTFVAPAEFQNVQQVLILDPGAYQVSGKVRMSELKGARGVQWQLVCVSGSALTPNGSSAAFLGSSDWSDFSFPVVIPEAGCDYQLLQLVVPARIRSELELRGKIWFDDLKIGRSP
ncbi:hypothetical protein SAMN02745157_4990 [Kaistia soli DSM 19436]|uniref:Tetratricopeptide repeat-containing protein n=1 Tax=Kaistia soli DSM 19436 TaxID=1122133 RepID=A0A1M5NGV3_9HYPH|nr:hypothetical protein [Kaistia soli]SHG88449.1 hypothetical protein SAMN02745157_4990 [Kaistia soli DSM 19436]